MAVYRQEVLERVVALMWARAESYASLEVARAANRYLAMQVAQRFADTDVCQETRVTFADCNPAGTCPLAVLVAIELELLAEREDLQLVFQSVRSDERSRQRDLERQRREEASSRKPGPIIKFK